MSFHHDYRRRCCLCRRLLPTGCAVCPDGCKGTEDHVPTTPEDPTPTPSRTSARPLTPLVSPVPPLNTWQPRYKCGCLAPIDLPAFAAAQMICRMHANSLDELAPGTEKAAAVVTRVGTEIRQKRNDVAPRLAKPGSKTGATGRKANTAVQDLSADWIPDAELSPEEEGRKAAVLARSQQAADVAMDERIAADRKHNAARVARQREERAAQKAQAEGAVS